MDKLSLFLFFFLSSLAALASSDGDVDAFVYCGCSQGKYAPGSPYQLNVESLLSSLANSAAFSSYASFTSSAASSSAPAYGLFQCRADLPVPDCSACVRSALSQLSALCDSAAGAAVQLHGCYLRYGNDSFLGKPDNTVLYKKCGPSPGGGGAYNGGVAAMRDSALAALTSASGPPAGGAYRVGGSGYVQAEAQCVGDLSAKECNNCVGAAVAELQASCGSAVAGEAYLGKCYARYWSNGGYASHIGHHGDGAGKTLAIIIGLLAGVALIIFFLSFIRRTENGKS